MRTIQNRAAKIIAHAAICISLVAIVSLPLAWPWSRISLKGPEVVKCSCQANYTAEVLDRSWNPSPASVIWFAVGGDPSLGAGSISSGLYTPPSCAINTSVQISAGTSCPNILNPGGFPIPHFASQGVEILGNPSSISSGTDFQNYVQQVIRYLMMKIEMNSSNPEMQELLRTLHILESEASFEIDNSISACGETDEDYTVRFKNNASCLPDAEAFIAVLIHEACHVECGVSIDIGDDVDSDGDGAADECDHPFENDTLHNNEQVHCTIFEADHLPPSCP